jgi:carbamoyltransferase
MNSMDEHARIRASEFSPERGQPLAVHSGQIKQLDLPNGCILGLNYSGVHDSSIAIIDRDGAIIFASALERITRVKQDGRPPYKLLDYVPWDRVEKVAVSTSGEFTQPDRAEGVLLTQRLSARRSEGLQHEQPFYDFLNTIPVEKIFVEHQLAHAASAFWASGLDRAICLTYDGGMFNSPWFGGLFAARNTAGLRAMELFDSLIYCKITSLYTFITALLGFTPNRHEGKITGLAAFGQPSEECRALMKKWFEDEYLAMESTLNWRFRYSDKIPPTLLVNNPRMASFRREAEPFAREELAAAVQELAEHHVIDILNKIREAGWLEDAICLAGGLFANVKINQRVAEFGFKHVFVAPPMTDDGAALGAAWQAHFESRGRKPRAMQSMYLGARYSDEEITTFLESRGVKYVSAPAPARRVAELLADGKIVAIFDGAMEFGPRALGNRSILAEARDNNINKYLNYKLRRTEFMPFAPITRIEDADKYYIGIDTVGHAAEFMTITLGCTSSIIRDCPAVVHVDSTARPQLVRREVAPLIYDVLTCYRELTGRAALVNTSFNIHEEPIVCSPNDALQGFFEAGLDYLYLQGGIIVNLSDNIGLAYEYLRTKLRAPSQKTDLLEAINRELSEDVAERDVILAEKEQMFGVIDVTMQRLNELILEKEQMIHSLGSATRLLDSMLLEKEQMIHYLDSLIKQKYDINYEHRESGGRRII